MADYPNAFAHMVQTHLLPLYSVPCTAHLAGTKGSSTQVFPFISTEDTPVAREHTSSPLIEQNRRAQTKPGS